MKWIKLGKIFDPSNYELNEKVGIYAQSPQALVYPEFIRIYFSTRFRDNTGKYVSHVSSVDFDKKLSKILNISKNEIISIGKRGCFDEHGIFPFNVIRYNKKIIGYSSGISRRISVPVETSIGMSLSVDNGNTFKRIGNGPVLSSSKYEPCMVGDPFVKFYNNNFHMWYIYGEKWATKKMYKNAERIYKIGHARSIDGENWVKDNIQLLPNKFEMECQALPTVIKINDIYHMWFCYRKAFDFRTNIINSYKIGYAFSNNLITWKRRDNQLCINRGKKGDWDFEMQCYPNVFRSDSVIYMLYNGNQFGRMGFGVAKLEHD